MLGLPDRQWEKTRLQVPDISFYTDLTVYRNRSTISLPKCMEVGLWLKYCQPEFVLIMDCPVKNLWLRHIMSEQFRCVLTAFEMQPMYVQYSRANWTNLNLNFLCLRPLIGVLDLEVICFAAVVSFFLFFLQHVISEVPRLIATMPVCPRVRKWV